MVANHAFQDLSETARELLESGRSAIGVALAGDIQSVYRRAESFFALPEVVKLTASLPPGCGYQPFGLEHSGDPARPDQVDVFVASPRMEAHARHLPCAEARDLHRAMIEVFDALDACAEGIARWVARAVGGDACAERIRGGLRRWSVLEVHHARSIPVGALINEAHEDGTLLSLAHATAEGLELEGEGGFSPPARTGDVFNVLPGQALTLLTGGAIPPLHHRVVAHRSPKPRMSLLLFADLDPSLCAPWRSTHVNDGVDIGAHVLGNASRFGVDGLGSDEGHV